MVNAYHVIFGAYGFWLPNDPRGSWSEFTAAWELFRVGGKATTTTERRSLANQAHDRERRERTKEALKYPPVAFDGPQALSIANGFATMSAKANYQGFACSILPQHVHLVLGRCQYPVETMVRLLKAQASHRLIADERHPLAAWPRKNGKLPTPWGVGCWKVFLETAEDIARAVRYVEENPVKEGKRRQRWKFVMRREAQSARLYEAGLNEINARNFMVYSVLGK